MATVILFYTFSKSGSKWIGGIKNIYHDPCQDWMDLINMKLTSPNYNTNKNKDFEEGKYI